MLHRVGSRDAGKSCAPIEDVPKELLRLPHHALIWLYDYYRPVYDVRFAESPLKLHSLEDFVDRVRTRQP